MSTCARANPRLPCGGPQAALSYTPPPVYSQDSAVKVRNSNNFSTGGNSSAPVYLRRHLYICGSPVERVERVVV
eukprot:scaffold98073_cov87-Phaeocystis_antarctica.AAC.1